MEHKTEIIGGGSTAVALWTAYIRETEGLFDHILCMLVQTWAHLPSKKVAPAKEQARKVLFMPDSLSGRSPGLEILVQLIHPCIDESVQSEEPAPQVQSPKTARPRPGERAGQQGQVGPPGGRCGVQVRPPGGVNRKRDLLSRPGAPDRQCQARVQERPRQWQGQAG